LLKHLLVLEISEELCERNMNVVLFDEVLFGNYFVKNHASFALALVLGKLDALAKELKLVHAALELS
jgi:hypothetical protein